MSVPADAWFVWFGDRLPFWAVVAVRSAARAGGFERVRLVHRGLGGVPELAAEPRVEIVELDDAWLRALPDGPTIARSFARLDAPAARSNLARLALLWTFGGVYLDADTITLTDLSDLRGRDSGFCGLEHLCLPADRSRVDRALSLPRLAARRALASLPRGHAWFRRIRAGYPRAVNNAILGATAEHPLLARAFAAIARMSPADRHRRYALGTHLLQRLTGDRSSTDFEVLEPAWFYPLGPVIAEHWFRPGPADALLAPQTAVVHWYASGRRGFDRGWVAAQRDRVAIAELAAPYLR